MLDFHKIDYKKPSYRCALTRMVFVAYKKGARHLVESITKFSKLICLLSKKKEAAKCCSLNDNYLVITALVSLVSAFAKSSSIVETEKS